jgi:hypothetical protein
LNHSVRMDNLEETGLFLKFGADTNTFDIYLNKPFHIFMIKTIEDFIGKVLSKRSFNDNVFFDRLYNDYKNKKGNTPLNIFFRNSLIDYFDKVPYVEGSIQDKKEEAITRWNIDQYNKSIDRGLLDIRYYFYIIDKFREKGADFLSKNNKGEMPLDFILQNIERAKVRKKLPKELSYFLERKYLEKLERIKKEKKEKRVIKKKMQDFLKHNEQKSKKIKILRERGNNVSGGKVFGEDENKVFVVGQDSVEEWEEMSKEKIGEKLTEMFL